MAKRSNSNVPSQAPSETPSHATSGATSQASGAEECEEGVSQVTASEAPQTQVESNVQEVDSQTPVLSPIFDYCTNLTKQLCIDCFNFTRLR